jgi:glucose-1-phosphatase
MAKQKSLPIKYLLSDLDGVIRHFSPERDQEIEQRCGLTSGMLLGTAFEKTLLNRAITGVISDESWRSEIIKLLSKTYTPGLATQAVIDWSAFPGKVDHRYLDYLEVKFAGIPVAVLTNGTSRLNQDLKTLGIADRFFKIFNSAEIGFCKPDRRVFDHVIEALDCKPSDVFFIDDSLSHVNMAKELGMSGHHYRSLEDFQKSMELA